MASEEEASLFKGVRVDSLKIISAVLLFLFIMHKKNMKNLKFI